MAAKKLTYKNFGLEVYETSDGREYAVGTQAQAERAAKETILDSLWAFNASFIASFAGLDSATEKAIREMQSKLSEDANPLIRRLIGERNLNNFVKKALQADGLGHFLSSYDSEEIDSDDVEGLPRGKLAFRMN